LIVTAAAILTGSCDSNGDLTCQLLDTETHTASTPLVDPEFRRIALFEFQQELRFYEDDGSCELPSDQDEISLRIRNVTSCEYSFDYELSVFEGREGTTILGDASVRQNAVADQGVVVRDLGILIDRSQFILTGSNVIQGDCS
jgi:hypothetical protein